MVIAFDTETFLAAPGRQAPPVVCISEAGERGPRLHIGGHLAAFRELLESDALLVGHNVAYDLAALCNDHPTLIGLVFEALDADRIADTMICQRLADIATGTTNDPITRKPVRYSLSALVERLLGESVEGKSGADVWRVRYHELHGVPAEDWPQAARDYALADAALTLRVWNVQARALPADLFPQVRAAFALHLMRCWGIRTDGGRVAELRERLQAHVDAATSDLILAGVKRPNGSKDTARIKQLVEAAYMAKGQGAPRTEKGAIRTSEAVLRDCGDPTLRQLAEIMADEKELSAFVPVLEQGASAPIHAFWRVLGAASGRTSCTGPNLQQQPRRAGVRECYIPRAGNVFVAADYSIAELRALAQLLLWKYGQSQMADAIRAGHDLHLVTGAEIIGWTYGQIAEAYAAGDKEAKQARQLAKAANFGYPGGLGAETFIAFAHASYGIEISESQARQLKDQWLSAYPEMRLYFADVGALIGARGGRATVAHAVSGRVRGACNFTAACNTFFQGLVADGAKRALYLLTRAAYAERYDLHVRPVAFIHDEIIIECPESQATEAARLLVDCMTKGMSAYTPDIPVVVEAAAMRRWFKDAAPVWDGDRLIPWEPGQAKKELHWRASE